jgi:hypothetical protein
LANVLGRSRECPLCPGILDFDLFSYRERNFDAEVSDGAFDFRVPKQELHGPQVTGSTVNQRRLCSSQRMRTKELLIETDTGKLPQKEPCVLASGHALAEGTPAGE